MYQKKFYDDLLERFKTIVKENNLLNEEIMINAKSLTSTEAIGNPKRETEECKR